MGAIERWQDPGIVDELARLWAGLSDRSGWVRVAAVEALTKLGQGSSEVSAALLPIVRKSPSIEFAPSGGPLANYEAWELEVSNARATAADLLGGLGQTDPEVIAALLWAFRSPGDSYLSLRAVRAIGRLGVASPNVIQVLVDALKDKTSDALPAAAVLGMLARTAPAARHVLDNALDGHYGPVPCDALRLALEITDGEDIF